MRRTRQIFQIVSLLFFIFLFFEASYPFKHNLPVDLYLKIDPLIIILTDIAGRVFTLSLIYAGIFLILTLILGRVFCGWLCPMGTVLDIATFFRKKKDKTYKIVEIDKTKKLLRLSIDLKKVKYFILFIMIVSAIFATQVLWILDPIVLLTRTITTAIYPVFTTAIYSVINFLFRFSFLQDSVSSLNTFLSDIHLIKAESQVLFHLNILIGFIFIIIIYFEFKDRRFFCQSICPLGATLALTSRYKFYNQIMNMDKCSKCNLCVKRCKMSAIGTNIEDVSPAECIVCFECVEICPQKAISYQWGRGKQKDLPISISRREFVGSVLGGIATAGLVKVEYNDLNKETFVLRPPGAVEENKFLELCIRCQECVKICATTGAGLQPAFLESGLEGMWTPMFFMRTGYCEYNCNLCGQVCPTDAIKPLSLEEKQKFVIGTAFFDRSRCIPWYKNEGCIVCEEHCPVSPKAIIFKEEEVWAPNKNEMMIVKRPYIVEERCIGCGICETKCPVNGRSAIILHKKASSFEVGGYGY